MTEQTKAEWLAMQIAGCSDNAIIYRDAAAAELRRLAPMEQELQNLREERTALLVNEQNLRAECEALRRGLQEVEALIDNSHGVAGLHLNGDVAPWGSLRTGGEFEAWLIGFDAAIGEKA